MNVDAKPDSHFDKRIVIFFVLAFSAGGMAQPFINLYLVEQGMNGTQIGFAQGWGAFLAFILTPLIGLLADRTQRYRLLLRLAVFGKGLAVVLLPLNAAWLWLATAISLRTICAGAQDALMNRLTIEQLQRSERRGFGAVRFWGGVGFAATSIIGGWLAQATSLAVVFPLSGLFALGALFFAGAFPRGVMDAQLARASTRPLARIVFLFAIVFLYTVSATGIETFGYILLAQELGADMGFIGLLGGVTRLATLPAFYLADFVLRKYGASRTFALHLTLHLLAWFGYAWLTNLNFAFGIAIVQGVAAAFYIVALVTLLGELSTREQAATNQVLAQLTLPGLAGMLAQPIGGWIFQSFGGRTLFALDTLIVLATLGLLGWRALNKVNQVD